MGNLIGVFQFYRLQVPPPRCPRLRQTRTASPAANPCIPPTNLNHTAQLSQDTVTLTP
ncbi:hypothetical protein SAICODRAFT_28812 [Saitoella complicata NRRL Y-17804]|uniref:uncharacterized protein n=1 Tax=Saitoella complicata (strain BCRC 22490 / CBS 7301 / JCM 7358 / NBRC 10748 / NRRL Y-17804) TaxID=698492 RepID=UPI000866CF9F|nr:uncharacterized protein SAICODRAFT_28812 [Saitoella complicata NRRL Y-17804]ODQ55787.1 hypothetical protein SAICODRAFT_28812 [Saitoella complicata NRRL Y-17804]